MKKKMFCLIAVIASVTLMSFNLQADDGVKKVLAEKTFPVKPDVSLVINHENGNIICNNWDKNEIAVKLTAHAGTTNSQLAEDSFRRISWDVHGNNNEVFVQSKLSGKSSGSSPNIWVDIEIFMPKTINLTFSHKFGKASIETVDGVAQISSGYGSIHINSLSHPESKIEVNYGDGRVNQFLGNCIEVNYSNFKFGKTENTEFNSDYSDIEGDETENSSVKLEGGNFNLKKAISIKGTSSFSNLNIDELTDALEIETSYGSVNVGSVSEHFGHINIENNNGSVNLRIPSSANYLLDATAVYGSIVYPENGANITYRDKTAQKTILRGTIGNGDNTSSAVNLHSKNGSINITN